VAGFHCAGFFGNTGNPRHHRPLFEAFAQLVEILGRSHGENLHTPVAQISHVPVNPVFVGKVFHEIAVTYALHATRHHKTPSNNPLTHDISSVPEPPAYPPNGTSRPPPLRYTGARRQVAQILAGRILLCMERTSAIPARPIFGIPSLLFLLVVFGCCAPRVWAQDDAPGPLTPPPEHEVKRIVGVPKAEAPPSLPPAEIIAAFTKKEDLYFTERPLFSYRRTVKIQEFGPDGHPSGEYDATYQAVRAADGQLYERALAAPETSLQYLQFEPEDAHYFTSIPAFPLTTSQLNKYNVQFLGTEKVDEIDCYIFQIHPKTLERQHALFDGVIWVDQKYLETVKTYGQWITDLGPMHPASLPFSLFETYRENVEGKYWFPDYSRSDGIYKLKDREIPIRVTIKWTDFKPFPPVVASDPSSTAPPAPAPTKP